MIYRSAGDVLRDVLARQEASSATELYEVQAGIAPRETDGHLDGMLLLDLAETVGAPRVALDVPSWLLDRPGLSLASCAVMAAMMRGSREPICARCVSRRICRYEARRPGWVSSVVERELPRLARSGLVSRVVDGTWVTHA